MYVRGSHDIWLRYTPDTGLRVCDIVRPHGFLPKHMVSVGRYILMIPDPYYAYDYTPHDGYAGIDEVLMYDPVSGVFH
ncbi:hypothetical protein KIPB_014742, partial [Kipferlia bialata]|eukprot:g14742.t1